MLGQSIFARSTSKGFHKRHACYSLVLTCPSKPIPTPFPAFLTTHPCTNQTSSTNQNIDVHWTVRVDSYNKFNDFALSFKHDPGADSKGSPYDAAYDTSANGVLAPNVLVAQYDSKNSPVPLSCGEYDGHTCSASGTFTLPANKQ